jgi:spore germination cell wall hydrolase CwlJ-like protein
MKKSLILTSIAAALTFTVIDNQFNGDYISAESFKVEMTIVKMIPLPTKMSYQTNQKITLNKREQDCLVRNIYFESGIESLEGKIAVAQVTFNRLNTGRWGNDVCKVVHAKSQFSWTKDKKKLSENPKGKLWEESLIAMNQYLNGTRIANLTNSTHYHADWIDTPLWAQVKTPVNRIGQHVFYALK